jgi:hypothetical protein
MHTSTTGTTTTGDALEEVAPLLRDLRAGSARNRHAAVRALAALGARAGAAVPDLVALLRHADVTLRAAAAEALACVGRPAVPTLVEALQDPDPDFRKAAVVTLGAMGTDAARAEPALARLAQDEWLGPWAVRALAAIRRGGRPTWRRALSRLAAGLVLGAVVGTAVGLAVSADRLPPALDVGVPPSAVVAGVAVALGGVAVTILLATFSWGERRAVLLACVLGLSGGLAGLGAAALVVNLVGPLVRVFHRE